MNKFLWLACHFVVAQAFAQNESWHSGALVTADQEVFTGTILYHPGHDLLVFRSQGNTDVLMSDKLTSFRYFDAAANINRKYISINENLNPVGKKIYEVVLEGEISVLRRAINRMSSHPSDAYGYHYYFLHKGMVKNLRNFYSVLYPVIRPLLANNNTVLDYNPHNLADAIRMIDLFNHNTRALMALR